MPHGGVNWIEANLKCTEKDAHLVDIRNLDEWNFVTKTLPLKWGQYRFVIDSLNCYSDVYIYIYKF